MMKMALTISRAALGVFLVSVLPGIAIARQGKNAAAEKYPASYEGGNLPLHRSKVEALLSKDEVILIQHGRRIAVPASSITQVACATDVHRRLGASVLDVVPYVHLGESESHYVGVTWMESTAAGGKTPKVEVLFRLNRSEYNSFLAGLERLTGKKAVDTNQMRTTVRYD